MTAGRTAGAVIAIVVLVGTAACTDADGGVVTTVPTEGCADVVSAEIVASGDAFVVSATVRSADTGWDRYADAWEVRSSDGDVLGTRILAHPHVDEQPFTRSLGDVEIPVEIASVEVAARDSVVGYCGLTATVPVPGR
jgi:hypothetical protein